MRLRFSDIGTTKELANKNVSTGVAGLRHWWINKYRMPATHALFQQQSIAELNLEYYEDLYLRKHELEQEINKGSDTKGLHSALAEINKALGDESASDDPLIDRWEEQIARGEIPDLNEV